MVKGSIDSQVLTSHRLGASYMHILLVVRWPVGGIRTFLKYILQSFSGKQYKFSIITIEVEEAKALKDEISSFVQDWIFVPADGRVFVNISISVFKYCKNNKVDLIHAHGFFSLAASLSSKFAFQKKIICSSHDVISINNFVGIKGRLLKNILGFSFRQCEVVHSVSSENNENLTELFPSISRRFVTISNGVDTERFFNAVPDNLRDRFSIDESCLIIGFFGRFMSPKGFRFLVTASSILFHSKAIGDFKVVCFGSGAFIREEQAEIERRGLDSVFIFSPFISDVSGSMKGCDVIVMPSIWEASPLQPMEALSAGVPFVGTDCTGLRVVLEGSPSVIVKAGDGESLAKGITECLVLGRKPFQDYAQQAVARFDARRTVDEIQKIYERTLA